MTLRLLTVAGDWRSHYTRELLPLAAWLATQPAPDGVQLAPDDEIDALAGRLDGLALIAIDFPKFSDGRGYSLAHGLRHRLGYRGDLQAIGDVLIDQLFLLKRVGFTRFALRADQDADAAVAALTRYSDAYQGSVDQPLPIYRREIRAGAVA